MDHGWVHARRARGQVIAVACVVVVGAGIVGVRARATQHSGDARAVVQAVLTDASIPATPTATVTNNVLAFVDSANHAAVLAVREDPDNHNDAIVAIDSGRLTAGAGCRYLSQTDSDPSNDTAPGFDGWLRCANATGPWVLNLGDGNDQVSASHPARTADLADGKNVQIASGDGNDIVFILDGSASVDAGPGNDQVRGGPDDDVVHGGAGFDKLMSGLGRGSSHDELYGDDGNDTLVGGRDRDVLDGGAGLDVLTPGGAHDTINARDGAADEVDCGGDDAVADVLHFDPGVDKLIRCTAEVRKNPSGT